MKLGVNIDHVATLRQARGGKEPDPVWAARVCERAGAHSIVMHLREDRRHIQDTDLFRVRKAISIKLNLEVSTAPGIVRAAERLLPDEVTFVPERREERTTEGGLDLFRGRRGLAHCIRFFKEKGVMVSLFLDPDVKQVREAKRLAADAVELHTGDYANRRTARGRRRELRRLGAAAEEARRIGIVTHAGHGLDYENVAGLKAAVPFIEELNIGFSIVTRALAVGLDRAVREMLRAVG